jgi:hypothetical protein
MESAVTNAFVLGPETYILLWQPSLCGCDGHFWSTDSFLKIEHITVYTQYNVRT